MDAIYQPKGAAFEYSPLACNLYQGCGHGCIFCYAPAVLRKTKQDFCNDPKPRNGILKALEKDIKKFYGDTRPILLSFTSDCYQPIEHDHRITRQAIEMLGDAGFRIRVLTKNGTLAQRDFDLFKKYDVEFGCTIHLTNEADRKELEPHAGTITERMMAIAQAKSQGIRTWISVEPVYYPDQVYDLIDQMAAYTDTWKIGKLNHNPTIEKKINWREFLRTILGKVSALDSGYYIKDDLWKWADMDVQIAFKKVRGVNLFQPQTA